MGLGGYLIAYASKTLFVEFNYTIAGLAVKCHERQLQGLERKAKVEGSQLRLYKAKEGSRKHEAAHA
jgi:hypothetical protein